MLHRRAALTLAGGTALAAALPPPARAAHLARAEPAEVGLLPDRLARIPAWLSAEVQANRIPGAVVAIGRKGRLAYLESIGFRDREANAAMTPDAVFRLASMTKPIVSLGLMMLAEEGRVQLEYPISRYLPEFAEQRVGPNGEKPQRPTTVQDLLRHTSGLTYGLGDDPVARAYADAKLREKGITGPEFIRRLAGLPLASHPGSTWAYSYSTDVVGRIVEVVSGEDLNAYVTRRITGPLGMADTAFFLGERARGRVAEAMADSQTGRKPAMPDPAVRASFFSGGGGMSGTALDYARFCQMLLDMGHTEETRLATRHTVALMRANHLPPGIGYSADTPGRFGALAPTPAMGQGFGLGFCVRTEAGRNPLPGSVGDHYWGGAYGTFFWVDPAEEMYVVFMMQAPEQRLQTRYVLRQLVYQSLA
ncbi:serine hydrolase domain-containing protein [Paracraurococcus lichenis]|uniref:Serine hydrolase domain-containing protein n=1 Tax=Paracraurococcus lichenis TaxID=3064888 RepID=A0ABT9DU60_9PROT|nr:serine hydrolase domain-containing protein [Paracraurococcus sp. LOR1-02]MDO9707435.1 serine hydrolase domain-containing protein [Paracraurococcus sp. LOR1-02]